jgi:hypothetical protein
MNDFEVHSFEAFDLIVHLILDFSSLYQRIGGHNDPIFPYCGGDEFND